MTVLQLKGHSGFFIEFHHDSARVHRLSLWFWLVFGSLPLSPVFCHLHRLSIAAFPFSEKVLTELFQVLFRKHIVDNVEIPLVSFEKFQISLDFSLFSRKILDYQNSSWFALIFLSFTQELLYFLEILVVITKLLQIERYNVIVLFLKSYIHVHDKWLKRVRCLYRDCYLIFLFLVKWLQFLVDVFLYLCSIHYTKCIVSDVFDQQNLIRNSLQKTLSKQKFLISLSAINLRQSVNSQCYAELTCYNFSRISYLADCQLHFLFIHFLDYQSFEQHCCQSLQCRSCEICSNFNDVLQKRLLVFNNVQHFDYDCFSLLRIRTSNLILTTETSSDGLINFLQIVRWGHISQVRNIFVTSNNTQQYWNTFCLVFLILVFSVRNQPIDLIDAYWTH